jgi:hypothetical protein
MMTLVFLATLFAVLNPYEDPVDTTPQAVAVMPAEDRDGSVTEHVVFKTLTKQFPNPKQKGKLVIDVNIGFVEVEGYEGGEVVIEILTPREYLKTADDDSEFQKLFTPKYDFDERAEDNSIKFDAYNQDYALNLRVKVPYQTNLSLDSYQGAYITAKNIAGVIDAHSQHGDISLLDIAGSATAFSRNGCLKIAFEEVADDARLDFESYIGWIDLSLPESTAVSTAIASGVSNVSTAFAIESIEQQEAPQMLVKKAGRDVDEYQFGKINGGGIPLRIENENGSIKIRKTGDTKASKSP